MCDTFVSLTSASKDRSVIFGKNSDRPSSEPQLITYNPREKHSKGEMVQCTYISVPQVLETAAVILSQPFWIWGAEMGCNEYGVAIGNEAVYTKEPLQDTGLLGMDLLRLGLERGKTAKDALDVITSLLEEFGQGGSNAFGDEKWNYHNSFIIADPKEAFVLDTADKWWIVEKVNNFRSISNNISIRGKGDIRRDGIIDYAIEKTYCSDDDNFDFAINFSDPQIPDVFPPNSREACSMRLLTENFENITIESMMEFLREHEVGLCMHGIFQSTGSQISQLKQGKKSIHWLTGSTIPCLSIFKPYVFPADGFQFSANKTAPYLETNPEWFWSKHSKFIRPYKKLLMKPKITDYKDKVKAIERELIRKVNDVVAQENKIGDDEYADKIKAINKESWIKSTDMILK